MAQQHKASSSNRGALGLVGSLVWGADDDDNELIALTEVGPMIKPEPEEEKETKGAFQSDMLLTPEQKKELKELIKQQTEGGEEGKMGKRRALSYMHMRWPKNTLVYQFHSSSKWDKTKIMQGLNVWKKYTCVKFVPYSRKVAQKLKHHNRVEFFKGNGCYSYVGMISRGVQKLSIGRGCTRPGTIAHEVGHALGWHHEQSRPDRDKHVKINFNNIKTKFKRNFVKYAASQIDTHSVKYDVGSIMHYGANYFSKNGKPTIVAKRTADQFTMGNRGGFSFYDKKTANLMFGCANHCSKKLKCKNDGYLDKNCKCKCPEGASGKTCEKGSVKKAGNSVCYKVLTAKRGTIRSPKESEYTKGNECIWLIKAKRGSLITIRFSKFNVEKDSSPKCSKDKVRVYACKYSRPYGFVYCGNRLPPTIYTRTTMHLTFKSDFSKKGSSFVANYVIS